MSALCFPHRMQYISSKRSLFRSRIACWSSKIEPSWAIIWCWNTTARGDRILPTPLLWKIQTWWTAGAFLTNRKTQAKSIAFVGSRLVWQIIRPLMSKGRCNLSPRGGSVLFYIGMFGSQGNSGLMTACWWTPQRRTYLHWANRLYEALHRSITLSSMRLEELTLLPKVKNGRYHFFNKHTAAPCKVPALPWWNHPWGRRLVGCGSHFLSAWFYSPYL